MKANEKLRHKLRRQFTTGFLALVPISVSLFIIWWMFDKIDSLIGKPIKEIFGFYFNGMGIVLLVLIIWLVGVITSGYFGSKLMQLQDKIVTKIPVLRTIFKTLSQLSHSVVNNKGSFSQAVLVEVFNKGYYSIGFVTNKGEFKVKGKDKLIHVFVPTAPNPTSGFLMLISEDKLIKLDISVEEAFKSVVSAGMVAPEQYK
ncbi:MAG: DUF502 domain-containing protein [Spirochaetales bacterium]|nr:DUF502 domain-containing protein [Spirochaetales bacterium]